MHRQYSCDRVMLRNSLDLYSTKKMWSNYVANNLIIISYVTTTNINIQIILEKKKSDENPICYHKCCKIHILFFDFKIKLQYKLIN